ncbi:MAG: HyaD/HybD family hydrogenase maturation endopeptidase [Alphaproteobacteria bacterium]|nr:HyaD/HybD family hydrogenase maturation endopeptidase [Alphaproteobacteria bacterium]
MKVVVLGIGNILLSDEGVGVRAVDALVERWTLPPEVKVIDGGTMGMELLDHIAGAGHLVVVDAVRAHRPPGTVFKLTGDEVPAFFKTKLSPHQIGLSDVLATLILTDEQPVSLALVGVQPVTLGTNMALSPEVEAKIDEVIALIIEEIEGQGLTATRKGA